MIRCRRFERRKKEAKQDCAICYSAAGFLADILEHNGFIVNKLERVYRDGFEVFHVDAGVVDAEPFRARLRKALDKYNLHNPAP